MPPEVMTITSTPEVADTKAASPMDISSFMEDWMAQNGEPEKPETPAPAAPAPETPTAPDQPRHSAITFDRAAEYGISRESASAMSGEELSKLLYTLETREAALIDRVEKKVQEKVKPVAPAVAHPEDEFDIGINPDDYEANDPVIRGMQKLASANKKLRDELKTVQEAMRGQEASEFETRIERMFANVPAEWKAHVGEGTSRTIPKTSPNFQLRGEIIHAMGALGRAFGNTKTPEELFVMAGNAVIGSKAKVAAKPDELQRRESEFAKAGTAVPTDRTRQESTGEAKARATVREHLRKAKQQDQEVAEFMAMFE